MACPNQNTSALLLTTIDLEMLNSLPSVSPKTAPILSLEEKLANLGHDTCKVILNYLTVPDLVRLRHASVSLDFTWSVDVVLLHKQVNTVRRMETIMNLEPSPEVNREEELTLRRCIEASRKKRD